MEINPELNKPNTSTLDISSSLTGSKSGDITEIAHKLTEEMESDYFEKGLQGKLFFKHYRTIMGLEDIYEYAFNQLHN